jgi:hypothetical protein
MPLPVPLPVPVPVPVPRPPAPGPPPPVPLPVPAAAYARERAAVTFPGMTGRASPQAQLKLAVIAEFLQRVHRVHGLVEQFATAKAKSTQDALVQPLRRGFQQLKLQFMGAGYDALSQLCGSMEIAVARGGSMTMKVRILREGIGSLRFQLELEQRSIVTADLEAQARAARVEGEG